MWRDNKFLVLTDDVALRQEIEVIFSFLQEETVALTLDVNWRQALDAAVSAASENTAFVGVLLGSLQQPAAPLVEALFDWNPGVPIVVLNDSVNVAEVAETARAQILANIKWPASYNKVVDVLHRCQMYREQYEWGRNRQMQRDTKLFHSLVGSSRQVQQIRELMAQVADKDVSVLILGESGTGKEVVARNLHYHSERKKAPFVPVNCGAIPPELLESELFGHEKGAFTGAITSRPGRFEMAEGGTLFLDEIGDMPLAMQVKLLRVLQEHTYERVGGSKTYKTDVRIVAATHRNLEQMIIDGTFREDLYYRLNVFPIEMPSLRERSEDIPLLINELIRRIEAEKRGSLQFNSAAIMSLTRHDWPGNVRELANLVERLVIMHPFSVVGIQELPMKYRHVEDGDPVEIPVRAPAAPAPATNRVSVAEGKALLPVNGLNLKEYLTDLEQDLIVQALEDCDNVVARAAERLHLRRTTLVEKMRKYGLMNKEEA
ncbi:sigma-54 dependent transcriptional regulator [Salinispirillum marinum]|uniref:Sigma-54 dependent transcriptional regulator n=2 Tax=Saccharospirillaceae TaxID=255527 RepID=A0ABV8BEU3_9GAMM